MLDFFAIFGKGGIVLWALKETQQAIGISVNALIREVFLQERGNVSMYKHEGVTLKFKLDNEFELVFLVAYQSVVQLAYIDKFLDDIQLKFRDKYKNVLSDRQRLFSLCGGDYFSSFQTTYQKCLKESQQNHVEKGAKKAMRSFEESEKSQKTIESMIISKGGAKKGETVKAKAAKKVVDAAVPPVKSQIPVIAKASGAEVNQNGAVVNGLEEDEIARKRQEFFTKRNQNKGGQKPKQEKAETAEKPGKKAKKNRVWDLSGNAEDAAVLDYSSPPPGTENGFDAANGKLDEETAYLNQQRRFVGTMKGELAGLDEEEAAVADEEDEEFSQDDEEEKTDGAGWFSAFKGLVGNKKLTEENVRPALDKMKDHLIGKNVAAEIAVKLCDSVGAKLEGKVIGTFSGVTATVKETLRDALVQLLSPKRRVDILRDVIEAKRQGRPYTVVFCGVNGVGKSTNLAKITFWLNENNCKVLIAACDTFRAGAVEQLRTHTRHLNALHPESVRLYEQGYGKDPANIAMSAVMNAKDAGFDVVLVDTAGRMQDNEPLMRSLAKLINVNMPDLVLFVGEALVGNEAVDQLVRFNQALADHAPSKETGRLIDGIVFTKFDTIDDKVGAAISMTYITGQPIVFVGTGQTYKDLRNLNAVAVVNSLLK